MNEENTMSNEELRQELQKLDPKALIKIKAIIDTYERLKRAAIFSCICFIGGICYLQITGVISLLSYLLINIVYCALFCALIYFDFNKIVKIEISSKEDSDA